MDYDLPTSSAAWQYQPEVDGMEDGTDRPHTANAPRRRPGRPSKKAVGAGRSSLARPGTSAARVGGSRPGRPGRPGASGSRILFKRTGTGSRPGGSKKSLAGTKKAKKKANGFHDAEALQEQLRAAKLQVQHWRAACRKQTTKCNSLEAELRRTDRKLEATVARRGGDAGLNNAQMRSEVRRLRDYVHDLQARNEDQEFTIRELEKSTRKTRVAELEIECEECYKQIEHLRRALRTEAQRVDRSHRTGQATLMTSVRVTEEFKAVKAEKQAFEKKVERLQAQLEQERFRVVNGQRISTTSVLSMQHERVKSYEKIIMTLKSENARLKNELKNAVLGLQREKKDAGKAKKEAEIAAQQAEAAKLKAALHEAAVNARAGAISGGDGSSGTKVSVRDGVKTKEAQRRKEEREKKLAAARARGNQAQARRQDAKSKAAEDKAKQEQEAKAQAEAKAKADAEAKAKAKTEATTKKAESDQGGQGDDDDYGDDDYGDDYGDDDYGDDDYGDDDAAATKKEETKPAMEPAKPTKKDDDDDDYGDDYDDDDDDYGDDFD